MNQPKEVQDRLKKVQELREMGINPYQDRGKQTHFNKDLLNIENLPDIENVQSNSDVSICGRLLLFREHGKISFGKLRDESAELQICFMKDVLDDDYKFAKKYLDLGDYVEAQGDMFLTHKGEPTLLVRKFKLISKAIRPLPEKFHGVSDIEIQYRKRYLQTSTDRQAFERFRKRTILVQKIRDFLNENRFMEVTTPTLSSSASGALAKPFTTFHNATKSDFYLRIAPETALKKAVACGFERVYEFAINFRNEGLDPSHLPEFMMLEFYASYWNYEDLMDFTEKMIKKVIQETCGTLKIEHQGKTIDFSGEYPRVSMRDLIFKDCGIDIYIEKDLESLKKAILDKGIKVKDFDNLGYGNLIDNLYKKVSRPKIINPIFLINHPVELSPLARMNDENPEIVDRFQLVCNTWEILNAYSELTDPVDQKQRFMQQAEYKSQGDDEAMMIDFSFLDAMEHGFPPMAGFGMGIERLLCLLLDQENLRDVVLFPMTKSSQEEIDAMQKLGQSASQQSGTQEPVVDPGFTRDQAVEIVKKYVDPKLQPHLFFVEAAMRKLADHYGFSDQKEVWGLAGLLHDVDWSITEEETLNSNPLAHCGEKLDEILSEINASQEFIEILRSHYKEHGLPVDTTLKKALYSVDELCGLIVAVTLVRPSKQMADVKVSSIKKKFKDKGFAASVDRSLILTCEESLKTPIDEMIRLALEAMKEIAKDYGM